MMPWKRRLLGLGIALCAACLLPQAALAQGGEGTAPAPPQAPIAISTGDTLGEFNYDGAPPFPNPPQTVGTFMYAIPAGDVITSAVVTGQWGNSVVGSTAPHEVYIDGLLVATCLQPDPCYTSTVPWSYTFAPAEYALLADGSAVMTVIQTDEFVIRLGETTLAIETAPGMPTLPRWAFLTLAAALLGGALWLARKRTAAA